MNLYVYDDFLNKSRYNRTINRIEIRLTDLGLNGKIIRLGSIKNINSLIQQEIRSGAKNIIAVGNNETANKVASALVDDKLSEIFTKDILFSIIPVGENQSIANSLGMEKEEKACNIILARRIENINIGLASNKYFINKAEIFNQSINLDFKKEFLIEVPKKTKLTIYNLNDNPKFKSNNLFTSNKDKLKILISDTNNNYSFFSQDLVKINGNSNILLDNYKTISLPSEIRILNNKLKVIVGKNRLF
jgi:hypothetical protein